MILYMVVAMRIKGRDFIFDVFYFIYIYIYMCVCVCVCVCVFDVYLCVIF